MTVIESLHVFGATYNRARISDDWAFFAGVLAEDVVQIYPLECYGGGVYEGRDALLFYVLLREWCVLRRFDHVYFAWFGHWNVSGATVDAPVTAVLQRGGLPDLRLEFAMRVTHDEGLAIHVDEDPTPASRAQLRRYLVTHGAELGARTDVFDFAISDELKLLTRGMERSERILRCRNRIATARGPRDLVGPAWVDCHTTWRGPGLPDLTLDYALRYDLGEVGVARAEEIWTPAMQERLQAHLQAHRGELEKRAGSPGPERRGLAGPCASRGTSVPRTPR